jgi:hypothetical protein
MTFSRDRNLPGLAGSGLIQRGEIILERKKIDFEASIWG